MNAVPKFLLVVALIVAGGAAIYEGRIVTRQHLRIGELEAAATKSDRREQQLRGERVQLLQKLTEASRAAELATTTAAAAPEANPTAKVVAQVRAWMERLPGKTSPEMGFLADSDIVAATNNSPLETEDQAIRALAGLRAAAQGKFTPLMMGALRRYLAANGDVLPAEATQLAPYFNPPVDPAILPRYEMLHAGPIADLKDGMLVGQRLGAMIEGPYDVQFLYSLTQVKVNTLTAEPIAFQHALERFAAANGGQKPAAAEQLQAYLSTAIEPARLRELFDHLSSAPAVSATTTYPAFMNPK